MLKRMKLASLAVALGAIVTGPGLAEARSYANDYLHVVDVNGSDSLKLRSGPSRYDPVIGEIPFNAGKIKNRGRARGRWLRVSYLGTTGWVKRRYLAAARPDTPLTYRVVGVSSWENLNIRRKSNPYARVVGQIPADAGGIEPCGACKGSWCPIRYHRVDGWVHQRYLAVEQAPEAGRTDDSYRTANGSNYDDGDGDDVYGVYAEPGERRHSRRWRRKVRRWLGLYQ